MKIGDIVRGTDRGLADNHLYIWHACVDCGKERWQLLRNGKPQTERCASCAGKIAAQKRNQSGERHWNWKGGRQVTKLGYVEVKLSPDSPYFPMAGKDGYIYEHRLVMAQYLERCLDTTEEIHHINGVKDDNRVENLELNGKSEHNRLYHSDIRRLLLRIGQLEDTIRVLTTSSAE